MKYSVEIVTVPDREHFVAEIWDGDTMIAEVNHEQESLTLEVYSRGEAVQRFDYEAFLAAITKAKSKLRD